MGRIRLLKENEITETSEGMNAAISPLGTETVQKTYPITIMVVMILYPPSQEE
jgi:hypothetical protein